MNSTSEMRKKKQKDQEEREPNPGKIRPKREGLGYILYSNMAKWKQAGQEAGADPTLSATFYSNRGELQVSNIHHQLHKILLCHLQNTRGRHGDGALKDESCDSLKAKVKNSWAV